MKQILIRTFAPGIPVFDFSYGEVLDGQYHTLDVTDLPSECLTFVQRSDLLGTQAFIRNSDLRNFIEYIIPYVSDVSYYDRFIVFTLGPNYGTKEEKKQG